MKKLIPLFFILSNLSFSQYLKEKEILGELPKDNIYILDSVKTRPEHFPTTGTSFMQISDDYAIFVMNYRGTNYSVSGKINNPLVKVYDGDTVDVFTMITDTRYNNSAGERYFFGISKNFKKNGNLYILNQPKSPEYYINAHYATNEEIDKLLAN